MHDAHTHDKHTQVIKIENEFVHAKGTKHDKQQMNERFCDKIVNVFLDLFRIFLFGQL